MFHENSHDHIDQDELSHQHEDHEEEGGEECCYTAVLQAVRGAVTLLTDCVLHYSVPIVSWQWEEGGETVNEKYGNFIAG